MPKYILMSKLTPEGRRTILEKPDRIKEVNKEIEAFGAKVLQQYSLLGPYDFINILEAPSNDIINKVSIILGSRGTIEITSMPAMKIDDFISILKTKETGYFFLLNNFLFINPIEPSVVKKIILII